MFFWLAGWLLVIMIVIIITRDEARERRCEQIVVERSRHAEPICKALEQ